MKRLAKIISFVLLAALVTLAILWFRLDAIAQNALESNLSRELGVPTRVERLKLKRFSGEVHLDQLTLDNPQGFSKKKMIRVETIDAQLTPLSLFQPRILVDSLTLEKINVNFEQNLSTNNILQMVESVQGRKKQASPSRGSRSLFSFKDKKFKIDTVKLNTIQANVNFAPLEQLLPFKGLGRDVRVELPDIELRNLTSENAPDVLEEKLNEIVDDLLQNITGGLPEGFPKDLDSGNPEDIIGDFLKKLPF